jgi:lysozyme
MSAARKFLMALAAVALIALAFWVLAHRWRPAAGRYPVQGVDVSATDGEIDWPEVKQAGAAFAYLEATAGDEARDGRFARNWEGAAAAGLRRGAVHRFSLCRLARDQATSFLATVPRDDAALAPAVRLDFDAGCAARPDRAVVIEELATFLTMIEAHTGKPAILRVSAGFERAYQITAIVRPLWLEGSYRTPRYGARGWTLWRANPARWVDGLSAPVAWSVVRP